MKAATFALIFGIVYLALGLLGLLPAALRPPPPDAPPTHFTLLYGYLLDIFPVNVLLSAVHLAVGALGIAAWRGMANPLVYARSIALLYGALAVMGLIPGMSTLFGLMPLHGHDVWLHAGSAAIAAYFGWRATEPGMERRTRHERRQLMLPVAQERRFGLADRRHLAYIGA